MLFFLTPNTNQPQQKHRDGLPAHTTKAQSASRVEVLLHMFQTSAIVAGSGQVQDPAALPWKRTRYQLNKVEKRKMFASVGNPPSSEATAQPLFRRR